MNRIYLKQASKQSFPSMGQFAGGFYSILILQTTKPIFRHEPLFVQGPFEMAMAREYIGTNVDPWENDFHVIAHRHMVPTRTAREIRESKILGELTRILDGGFGVNAQAALDYYIREYRKNGHY